MPIQKIRKINLTDHSNQKAKCNLGSCAEKEMSKLDRLDQKQVDDTMKVFLASACNYLLERLHLDNQVIRDARYLHPYSQGDENSSGAIERLVTVTWNALGLKGMILTFNLKPNSTTFELIDLVKKELDEFKLENIPKDFIDKEKSSFKLKLSNPSYWRECYDLVGLQKCDASDSMVDVEEYWIKVMTMEDEDGKPKAPGKPERGFSINKRLLEKHGSSIGENTLEAIRIIKDFLILSGGQDGIKISSEMIEECRASHSKYEKYKAEQEKKEK